MPDTVFVINELTLQGFEIPERVGAGGEQSLNIHKLVGGERVIDSMGADDRNLKWSGTIFSTDSYSANDRARQIDLFRRQGKTAFISWYSNSYIVVIKRFEFDWERYYQVPYEIECVVLDDLSTPSDVAPPQADQLVPNDMSNVLDNAENVLNMTVPNTLPGPVSTYSGIVNQTPTAITWNGGLGTDLTGVAASLTDTRAAISAIPSFDALSSDNLAATLTTLGDTQDTIVSAQSVADQTLEIVDSQGNLVGTAREISGIPGPTVGNVIPGAPPLLNAANFMSYSATAQQDFGLINTGSEIQRMSDNLSLANNGPDLDPLSWDEP